jgi:DNA-binding transcriptional ArsR family regulator
MQEIDPLYALADPTRRKLFERLRRRSYTVNELTRHVRVTQSAVSQHLKVLRQAGLVQSRASGTRRHYELDLTGIARVREYLDRLWMDVLASYTRSTDKPVV